MPPRSWTDDEDQIVLEESEKSTPARVIATMIGRDVTKNAVIGRKTRILNRRTRADLQEKYPNLADAWFRPKGEKHVKEAPQPEQETFARVREIPKVLSLRPDVFIPLTSAPRTDELRYGMCRFPTHRGTDNEWRMCGKQVTKTYCRHHRQICFKPRVKKLEHAHSG